MLTIKTIKEGSKTKIFSDFRLFLYLLIFMGIFAILICGVIIFFDILEKDQVAMWTVGVLTVVIAAQDIYFVWFFWKNWHGAIVLDEVQRKLEFTNSFNLQIPQSTFYIDDVSQISIKPTSTWTNLLIRSFRIVLKVRTGEEKTLDLNFPEKEATQTAKTIGEFFGVPAYDSENNIIFAP